ncbi:MAG: serine/threonine-protein kinase [Myxococcota bacterium]
MSDEGFRPFVLGRYNVLKRLGQGGMAEVLLAEQPGPKGFARRVTIKRVLPEHASATEFLQMFRDEARLGMLLQHPNIVQVLDFHDDPLGAYLVMEFVHGADLSALLRAMSQQKRHLPVKVSVFVAWSMLRGLSHAHSACSPDGKPLQLVHRDVSPSNVFLSLSGQVKLGDFGVAKALGRSTQTQVGVLKGKLRYMAPETLLTGQVDARADLFAAGVVLWESLATRVLFTGKTDFNVAEAVMKQPFQAPSTLNPEVPPLLDEVVRRALEKDPLKRFQTAREFEQALFALLGGSHPDALGESLSELVRTHTRVIPAAELDALPRPVRQEKLAAPAPLDLPGLPPTSSVHTEPTRVAPAPKVADWWEEPPPPPPPPVDDFFAPLLNSPRDAPAPSWPPNNEATIPVGHAALVEETLLEDPAELEATIPDHPRRDGSR